MKWSFCLILTIGLISFAWGELTGQTGAGHLGICAEARRRFAYKFYAKAVDESNPGDNVFLAPTTVASALGAILAGARGNTKDQIWRGLMSKNTSQTFKDDDLSCLLLTYSDDLVLERASQRVSSNEIRPIDNPLVLRTASSLFGERTYNFSKSFIQKSASYGTVMKEMDFLQKPDVSRQFINDWTAEETEDKIKDLFGPGDITQETKLAVVSAIYFKGQWEIPFEPELTSAQNFKVAADEPVTVDFMNKRSKFRTYYSEELAAQLLELPYQNDAYGRYSVSMIIVLPEPMVSMASVEQKMSEDNLSPAISALFQAYPITMYLAMPKYKLTGDYKLKAILTRMGITDMFSPVAADLTGMRDEASTDVRPLYVSSAVHKTFVEVNEKGTEAAGATGMGIVTLSLPRSFVIDRPFLTMIYEKRSESILFIGKVVDPTAE